MQIFYVILVLSLVLLLDRKQGFSTLLEHIFRHIGVRIGFLINNRRSRASHPGRIRVSPRKLRRLCPEYYASGVNPLVWLDAFLGDRALRRFLVEDQLNHGDSRAAVIVSLDPLLIAAYTDELDCIALLRFPQEFVREYNLCQYEHLLTVNRYWRNPPLAPDLENGPFSYRRYTNFQPFIAEFLSDDSDRIRRQHYGINEQEWQRTMILGQQYLQRYGLTARDGHPSRCILPARVRSY
jgi:hypothetical protein